MLAKAHKRRFGVEIECGFPGGTDAVRSLFHRELTYRSWYLGHDGSGVELKTPVLEAERGFEVLREAMERLKENGGYVTTMDGMHVHHDAPEFVHNAHKCLLLVESWHNNIRSIHQMVSPYRRSSGACPHWRSSEIESLKDWANGGSTFYASRNDLNLNALRRHGSVEIRLHEGTLDPDVAIAWIMFGQRFIDDVLKRARPLKNLMNDPQLMRRIKLSKKAREILAEKQRYDGHRTPASSFR